MSTPFNYNAEGKALGINPENYATASLTNGRSARIASMTAESIPGIETKKTIINETNTALYTSLGDTYEILKKIYKNFDKTYLLAPTNNSERKKKYATLQTLQKEFNDEYERINSILPYTGNDKTIRTRIAEIRRYYEMKRNDIAEKIKIIKVNVESPSKDPDLLLPEPLPSNNSSLTPLPVTPSASTAAPAPVPALAPPPPQPAPRAPPRQWPPPGPIRLPGRNTRKNVPLPKRQLTVVPPPPLPQVSSTLQTQNTRKNSNVFNNLANNRQRARDLIRTSILGKQPVMTKMYQNTRRNGNRNALYRGTLESLYPNMSTLEEQPVHVQQSQKPNNNSLSGNSFQTLGMIERGIGVSSQTPAILPNPEQSDKKLFKNIHETATQFETAVSGKPATPQQSVQYIKLVNGTTYKFIEITDDNKAKVQKLDRVTKTWGPIEDLSDEQVVGFTEVKCPPSQAGGRRTRRRRRQRKQRKTRKA